MNLEKVEKFNLNNVLPGELKNSMLCYTFVNSKVLSNAPDIAICCSNGYMYEIKNKRILRSLNLQCDTSSLSCYYLTENKKLILMYLVYSACKELLIIRRTNTRLKIVKEYQDVENFQVYDFEEVGIPQIRINFSNQPGNFMCDFPVELQDQSEYCDYDSKMLISLSKELEDLKKFIDILSDEYNHLKKICFCSKMPTDVEKVFVGSPSFHMTLNKLNEYELEICSKWSKVLGSSFILGIIFKNVGTEFIDDLEVVINHKKIKDYTFIFFQLPCDITKLLFSNQQNNIFIKPGKEICAVVSFEIPKFNCKSVLSVACYVTSKNLKDVFIKEIFEISVSDIAVQTTVNLEDEFTDEVLLAVLASKSKTQLEIKSEDCTNDIIESSLEYLCFKSMKHLKDKLFYCTSTYLKEVFVAFLQISVNPSVWKMTIFTSKEEQVYFLVHALYDLLPDNSSILCDNSTD